MATQDLSVLTSALGASCERLVRLVRGVDDPEAPAVGDWSVADVASHLAAIFDGVYPVLLKGGEVPVADSVTGIAGFNEQMIAGDPDRSMEHLAGRIETGFESFVGAFAERPDDPMPWHAGLKLPRTTVASMILGEVLVHGYDIAHGSNQEWTIDPGDATLVLVGILYLVPHYLDPAAAAGVDLTYEIRLRGGPTHGLVIGDGKLTVVDGPPESPDCRISADPAAFMLVSYGRMSPWRAALTGKVRALGRKPWAAFKLNTLLMKP